jgi:hypothetical protein
MRSESAADDGQSLTKMDESRPPSFEGIEERVSACWRMFAKISCECGVNSAQDYEISIAATQLASGIFVA